MISSLWKLGATGAISCSFVAVGSGCLSIAKAFQGRGMCFMKQDRLPAYFSAQMSVCEALFQPFLLGKKSAPSTSLLVVSM
ncbi:hypothetical protein B5G02_00865 [[Collinsella] massiliensis]|uniref:Uncharacterized protein n=1 Tax=[Collinsella] massiliensis TaxID=1232426 RepID=A0A1Y3Y3I5_9ACTN|nr:hypothetical protein B5G02_00865 [[Collinsella] massiliensis]